MNVRCSIYVEVTDATDEELETSMLPSTEEIADITESVPQTTSHVTNTASKSMSLVMLVHVLVSCNRSNVSVVTTQIQCCMCNLPGVHCNNVCIVIYVVVIRDFVECIYRGKIDYAYR